MTKITSFENLYKGQRSLSIMPTFTCPAACENCGTLSSPQDKTNMELKHIISAIDQANELDFDIVVFTGGEATLRKKDLLKGLSHARAKGFPTRLVTNGHWAKSMDKALAYVKSLIDAGLSEINFSTGDEHTRFIPIDNVITGAVASIKLGLQTLIMVEYKKHRGITKSDLEQHELIKSLTEEEKERLIYIESPWMPLNPFMTEEYDPEVVTSKENLGLTEGCNSILQTYTIQADGRVGTCCGLGLRVIDELNVATVEDEDFLHKAIDESESDLLKLWIHYVGPEKILAWAAEKDPSIGWENMYAHHCQTCQRIYKDPKVKKVILEHYEEIMPELVQAIWLQEHYVPEQIKDIVSL